MQTKNSKKRAEKGRVFDSMAQAASVLGISKDSLQVAKARGCPAFRGSRVHEAELLAWIKLHRPEQTTITTEAELKQRCERLMWNSASLVCWLGLENREKEFPEIFAFARNNLTPIVSKLCTTAKLWNEEE